MSAGIEVHDLAVVYRTKHAQRRALDGLSFQADREFVAMLGPNGAGKSTLLGVISAMIHPDSGTVVAPASRKELGIVFQTPALDELLTVRENMILAGAMHGLTKPAALARLETLAGSLQIEDRLTDQVRHLSGGLRRRVDLARALIAEPTVLLLDEPTTGLDIDAWGLFWELLDATRADHPMTILLATHLTEEADRADRVLLMRDGRILADDSPETLKAGLGDRVLRIRTGVDRLNAVTDWLDQSGHVYRVAGSTMTIAHADQSLLAACPTPEAPMTLAPPTLGDVYTWHSGAGSLLDTGQGGAP